MISSNDLRPGVTIHFRGAIWQVVAAMHIKPGKGSAFVQTRLRNLEKDQVLSINFRAGERLELAQIERIEVMFLYRNFDQYILMHASGSDQFELDSKCFGRDAELLKEGLSDILIWICRGKVIRVELPNTVVLEVVDTPPDERGNTSSSGGKQATLETGAIVVVPFHIKAGDVIRIDTRTRQYVSRVSATEAPAS